MDHLGFLRLFQRDLALHGGAQLAERIGVSPQHVSDVKKGRRAPGPAVLSYYGLEKTVKVVRVITYEKADARRG